VFGTFGNYLAITSIEHIYLSIASLLNNTLPIFVIVTAYFMLGERLNSTQVISIVFALIGVVLMSLNSLSKTEGEKGASAQAIGFILMVLSEVAGALSYTSVKKVPDAEVMTLSFIKIALIYAVSVVYMLLRLIFEGAEFVNLSLSRLDTVTLLLFFGMAALDLALNLLIFKTFQLLKAGVGASMNFLCLIWSLILDVTLFNQSFSFTEISGGLLILVTTTLIVLYD
jgi:drug/metabolite transporter (DMT)-like permease